MPENGRQQHNWVAAVAVVVGVGVAAAPPCGINDRCQSTGCRFGRRPTYENGNVN